MKKIKPSKWIYFPHGAKTFYLDNDGILQYEYDSSLRMPDSTVQSRTNKELIQYMARCGYIVKTSGDIYLIGNVLIDDYLYRRIGISWKACCHEFETRGSRTKKNRDRKAQKSEAWKELYDRFNGIIFGVDNEIDFRGEGDFAVYLSIKTGSYDKQMQFLRKNQGRIVEYILEELKSRQYVMSKIGDLNFYRISSATLMRSSMVEFIFSPKKELEKLFAET